MLRVVCPNRTPFQELLARAGTPGTGAAESVRPMPFRPDVSLVAAAGSAGF